MQNEPKLSIIIPVYKVKEYLELCVKSILVQDYQNMEIILINDNSPDESGFICDKLAEEDSRIKVIHNAENKGVGNVRNTGLNNATGDYYTFVDSDDRIMPGCYRQMMEYVLRENLDVIQAKMILDFKDYMLCSNDSNEFKILSKEETLDSLINTREITTMLWDKIYKADIFNEIKFSEARSGEDTEIMYQLLWKSEKTGFLDKSFYYYRQGENSLTTQKVSLEHAKFVIDVYKKREEFFEEKSQSLYVSARKRCFTRIVGLFYSLKNAGEDSGLFLQEYGAYAGEILKSIPFFSIKERIVYNLLGVSLKNHGFLLRIFLTQAYKRKKSGLVKGLKKCPK